MHIKKGLEILVFGFAGACAHSGTNEDRLPCTTGTPVAYDDSSLGFTAEDFHDFIKSSPMPESITWDEATLGQKSADFSMTIDGYDKDGVMLVDRSLCEQPALLRVPMDASFLIAGGDLTAIGVQWFEASELSDAGSIVLAGSEMTVTLSGDYEESLAAFNEQHPKEPVTAIVLTGFDPWTAARIGVDSTFSTSNGEVGTRGLWDGHWQL